MKILVISADNFEDTELLVPYYRFREEGFQVDIASMEKGSIKGKHGYEVMANKTLREIRPDRYDLLFLPGGKAPETIFIGVIPKDTKSDVCDLTPEVRNSVPVVIKMIMDEIAGSA